MYIAAFDKQEKYAVVRVHGEVAGIYSRQDAAARHAKNAVFGRDRSAVTCRWESSEALNSHLREWRKELQAQLDSKGYHDSSLASMIEIIRNWTMLGQPTHCVTDEQGRTVTKP